MQFINELSALAMREVKQWRHCCRRSAPVLHVCLFTHQTNMMQCVNYSALEMQAHLATYGQSHASRFPPFPFLMLS